MGSLARAAQRDFNEQLTSIQASATSLDQETLVSVLTICVGRDARVGREVVNTDVKRVAPIARYETEGHATPMISAVFDGIKLLEDLPDYNDPEVSFLVVTTTDGQENCDRHRGRELATKIRELVGTDRWTFAFRVPKQGGVKDLASLGILQAPVSIFEWDLNQRGVEVSTQANVEAFKNYFTERATGKRATSRFYANAADVSVDEARKSLIDVSSEVTLFPVAASDAGTLIRPFVEAKLGEAMVRGGAFYQLVKLEPKVQANKRIAIRDKSTGTVFAGDAARQMLALPTIGTVRLAPDDLGEWDVFIQSTSVNRKLDPNTQLLYWKGVGKAFKEGPSAV
jgi:hypothetical protein